MSSSGITPQQVQKVMELLKLGGPVEVTAVGIAREIDAAPVAVTSLLRMGIGTTGTTPQSAAYLIGAARRVTDKLKVGKERNG